MPPLTPTSNEELEQASALLLAEAPAASLAPNLVAGLETATRDAMRAAVGALVEARQFDLPRKLAAMFRPKSDLGVWARVTGARIAEIEGRYEEGAAELVDLMQRFPQRASAHWWVALARCQIGMDRPDEAEATARAGIAKFPDASRVWIFLANFLAKAKRHKEAAEVWRHVIATFPSEIELTWLTGYSAVCRASRLWAEANDALEQVGVRFPGDRRTPSILAQAAADRSEWRRVLEIWERYAETYAAHDEPEYRLGRARALFRLWRIDEALGELRALVENQPDFAPALRELGTFALEMGDAAEARDCFARLLARFPEDARPEWWVLLARARADLREYQSADQALDELERGFPESALAATERLRIAKEVERGQDELAVMVEAALKRFPGDFDLRAHWIWILLGFGRLDLARPAVEALEADEGAGYALISRVRYEADLAGEEHIQRHLEQIAAGRVWELGDAIWIADFLLGLRATWAFALASRILEGIADTYPMQLRLCAMRARVMIARRDDAAALALIATIPAAFRRRETLELKAWAAAQRGDPDEAKALWRETIATNYFAAVDCPIRTLERLTPADRLPRDGGVTAYIVFRNEAAQIPGFLAHHRKLGVRRFVFIDHESEDDSRALLLGEPDVIVYRSPDSYQYSWSGRRWVNELVAREGGAGWNLQVDPDEAFVYPGCETVGIARFAAYLDQRGFEGVRGYMLDLFPQRLIDDRGEPTPLADYRYYDNDYVWIGQERPPYLQPSGGVRARLFEAKEFLHKTPLWKSGAGVLINSHETTPLRFADVTGALLHYKMMNVVLRGRHAPVEVGGTAYLEADSSVDAMRRHSRYAARLTPLWRADLFKPGVSEEMADSLTLAKRGLLEAPAAYLDWIGRG